MSRGSWSLWPPSYPPPRPQLVVALIPCPALLRPVSRRPNSMASKSAGLAMRVVIDEVRLRLVVLYIPSGEEEAPGIESRGGGDDGCSALALRLYCREVAAVAITDDDARDE